MDGGFSETRYRELVDTITSGVAVYKVLNEGLKGSDYLILDFNKSALEHEGKARDQVVGMRLDELRPHIDDYGLIPVFREVWKTGKPAFFPARVYVDENFSNWYENRVYRLPDHTIVAVYDDVTESKEAEEKVRRSEHLLRELVDGLDRAIAIYKPLENGEDFVFVEVNRRAEEIMQLSSEEVIGQRLSHLFPEASSVGLIEGFQEVHKRGGVVRLPLKRYEDERISEWVENTLFRLPTGNVVAVFEDTFEQRMAEKALRESEETLRSYFENAPDAFFILDVEGKCIDVNAAASAMSAYSREDLLHIPFKALFPKESQVELSLQLEEALNVGLSRHEHSATLKTGERRIWVVKAVRISEDRLMAFVNDVTDFRTTQESLSANETRYRLAQKIGKIGNWEMELDSGRVWGSEEAQRIFGFGAKEGYFPSAELDACIPELERVKLARKNLVEEKQGYDLEFDIVPAGGKEPRTINSVARVIKDDEGTPIKLSGIIRDITEQKKQSQKLRELEQQYQQSQKLETVGRLAGGIAHDFNNLLTVINSYASFLVDTLDPKDPKLFDVQQILSAGVKAAGLTSQLLAFSRKQVLEPKIINLNDVVLELEKLLRRILGEDIELEVKLPFNLGYVNADPAQIEQVLMNLAVNAREAMPDGGRLLIRTSNITLGEEGLQLPNISSGEFIEIAVEDSGHGMAPEVRARIFEPFFTTKNQAQGTGLGLATVYGIVKQSSGDILVESEEGVGSTFRVYLPRVRGSKNEREVDPLPPQLGGEETILVLEDEAAVRKLTTRILSSAGYHVVASANGEDALRKCKELGDRLDLVLTDVIMPKMSGKEFKEKLSKISPKLKVIFMSGYTNSALEPQGVLDQGTHFIAKPFEIPKLLEKVRAVLDGNCTENPRALRP